MSWSSHARGILIIQTCSLLILKKKLFTCSANLPKVAECARFSVNEDKREIWPVEKCPWLYSFSNPIPYPKQGHISTSRYLTVANFLFFTSGRFIACERELICAVTQVTRPARLGPASEASMQELGEGSFLFQYPCRALALLYCSPARHWRVTAPTRA